MIQIRVLYYINTSYTIIYIIIILYIQFISQIPHVSLVEPPISHHAICGHASYPLGTDHGSPRSLADV